MMQRCWEHDYCAPSFYMITVVTEPRRNCLSVLAGTAADPLLQLSAIGEVVREVWQRTSAIYPGVEGCECVVMPDHFHGILWVKERLERPMGHIVKAFKRVSTQECRSRGLLLPLGPSRGVGLQPASAFVPPADQVPVPAAAPAVGVSTLWQEGFQDSILLRKGQLKAMVNYIADNPRRLLSKRAHPELFTVVADQQIGPELTCPVIGNLYLLQHPLKRQVQISRRITPEALAAQKEELLYAAEHGAVLVSPCISPGEKEIAKAALEAGRPLIVLLENGFAPLYKPTGRYFEACVRGRLLMVAPFPYHRQKRTITREQCLALNAWAQTIVEMGDE
jgi:REP element-mobilizing transposase RayT